MSEFQNESFMDAQALLRLISKETWCTRAQSLIILPQSKNNGHAKVIKLSLETFPVYNLSLFLDT